MASAADRHHEPMHKLSAPLRGLTAHRHRRAAHVPARRGRVTLASLAVALAACGTAPSGPAVSAAPSMPATSAQPPLTAERIAAIVAASDRSDADRANDRRRMPQQLLAFSGVAPEMVVVDLSAGGGYTSELLARAVGPGGRVFAQSPPRSDRPAPAQPEGRAVPAGAQTQAAAAPPTPPRSSAVAVAARAERARLANLEAVVQPFENPVPTAVASGGVDLVTLMFNYHDLAHLGIDRERMNRAVYAALKPGGAYVIADHAGRDGTGISESGTLHRIEEAFLRDEVERAGFRLQRSADFLRNPADPRDRNTPEPPQPKSGFVLRFVKP
jgi:predicted methyltransferase